MYKHCILAVFLQVRQWNTIKHPALCLLFLSPASIMSALGAACCRQLALCWPFLHRVVQPVWVKPLHLLWTTWGSGAKRQPGSQTLHHEKQQFYTAPWSPFQCNLPTTPRKILLIQLHSPFNAQMYSASFVTFELEGLWCHRNMYHRGNETRPTCGQLI